MFGRVWLRVLSLVLVVGILAVAGVYVYNAGVAQGLATPRGEGNGVAPVPYPYAGPFFYPRFGFGFGWLLCLLPLLFFLLFPLFGWRRWVWRQHGGDWDKRVPPMFEAWHRRAHGQTAKAEPGPSAANEE